mmetsp:Transcript_10407/g.63534  ORF Transcript_10407/g.63534 Transcript_10407/m.63534 type:complete len:302 (+) Transcript_10407:12399-13304(+)
MDRSGPSRSCCDRPGSRKWHATQLTHPCHPERKNSTKPTERRKPRHGRTRWRLHPRSCTGRPTPTCRHSGTSTWYLGPRSSSRRQQGRPHKRRGGCWKMIRGWPPKRKNKPCPRSKQGPSSRMCRKDDQMQRSRSLRWPCKDQSSAWKETPACRSPCPKSPQRHPCWTKTRDQGRRTNCKAPTPVASVAGHPSRKPPSKTRRTTLRQTSPCPSGCPQNEQGHPRRRNPRPSARTAPRQSHRREGRQPPPQHPHQGSDYKRCPHAPRSPRPNLPSPQQQWKRKRPSQDHPRQRPNNPPGTPK